MSDLRIGIKVDPADSAQKADSVTTALGKAEDQGIKTQKAFDSLTSTFKRIADYQKLIAAESAGMKRAGDTVVASWKGVADAMRSEALNGTAKAFAGLTEQLQREEQMLDRIHGPQKRQAEDMQTLEMLYKRGAISAAEYTAQLEKMGAVHGPSKGEAGGSALDGIKGAGGEALGAIGGQIAGIAGPAAIATGAVAALGHELENFKQRGIDVDMAANSILKFHNSMEGAQAAMAEQRKLSDDLGMNIQQTSRAYAAVREATEGFGLSSKEATDITRNMTAAIIVDGGAIENVTGIMDKLQYASESGMLTQRELKAIWKESPEVVHMFEAALGKTYPQLMKMAAEGKLTGATLETMVHGTAKGTEAMDKYRQRLLEVGDVMELNKTDYAGAIEIMIKMHQQYQELADTGPEAFERSAAAASHQVVVLTELADKLQLIMTAAAAQGNFAANQSMIDSGMKVQAVLDGQGNRYEQFAQKVRGLRKELKEAGFDAQETEKFISQLHGPDYVDYYLQQLDAIRQPERDWAGRIAALDSLLKSHTMTVEQYGAALAQVTGHTREIGDDLPRNYALPTFTPKIGTSFSDLPGAKDFDPYGDLRASINPKATEESQKKTAEYNKMLFDNTKKWNDELREADKLTAVIDDQLKSAGTTFADDLVEAANGADVSWGKFFEDLLKNMEKAIAQAMVLEAIGSRHGGVGGTGTGVLGYLFGGNHAFGGSWTAPHGGGGQDSVTAMFRMSPGETATFSNGPPPPAAQGPGSPAAPMQVHVIYPTERGLLRTREDVIQVVLDDVGRNPGKWRSLIPAR
jgi:tape measure domain-containing protein